MASSPTSHRHVCSFIAAWVFVFFLLQQLREENSNLCEELKCLQVQNDSELREERSRRCCLLQEEAQGAAFNTQQLLLKLQQAEDKVRVRL